MRWWSRLWRRNKLEQELTQELQFHITERISALKSTGVSEEEARRRVRQEFGGVEQVKEVCREARSTRWLEDLFRDFRFGTRMLLRQPLFTITAVLTLGLVIGASGAIFSVLDAVLLRPLTYPKPQQLVLLFGRDRISDRNSISPADLEDWSHARSFQSMSALQFQSVNLTGVEEPMRLIGGFLSSTFFPMLGVQPARGRFFARGEDRPGGPHLCVVSYGMWQVKFGADPHVVGRRVLLNGEARTPSSASHRRISRPHSFRPTFGFRSRCIRTMCRIEHTTVSSRSAGWRMAFRTASAGRMATITGELAKQYPETNRNRSAIVLPLHEMLVQDLRPALLLLAGAVMCVLLIACANVAGLLLTQAFGRRQELAVRMSLGAGQARLIRQLLTEGLLLGLLGGLFGAGLAEGGIRLMLAYSDDIPKDLSVGLNAPVLVFLIALSMLTGLLFGIAPALLARREAMNALRQRGAAPMHGRLRGALVIGQVAFALILLVGAGLMVKSLEKLVSIDPGFKTDHLLTLEYRLPRNKYPSGAQQTQFHNEVVEKVSALPGVQSAADIRALPFSGNGGEIFVGFPDRAPAPPNALWITEYNAVSPEYFVTVGMPLLAGCFFTISDGIAAPRVVIVNRFFEKKFWPHGNAVGQQVLIPGQDMAGVNAPTIRATVVGIVPNTKHDSLTQPQTPQLYVPYAQDPFIFATLVVKTTRDPMAMTRESNAPCGRSIKINQCGRFGAWNRWWRARCRTGDM
jgi:predicted permease